VSRARYRRRRDKPAVSASDGWSAGLEAANEAAAEHGSWVLLHRLGCSRIEDGPCDCAAVLIGPAVRGVWQ